MLTRTGGVSLAALVLAGATAGVAMTPVAMAAPAKCVKVDPVTGVCQIWGNPPPGPTPTPPPTGPPSTNPPKPPVGAPPKGVQPITVAGQQCYPAGKSNPQPPKSDPVWKGHTTGAIYDCSVPPRAGPGVIIAGWTLQYWAATPPKAPPPPNPRKLAREAINAMQLHAIAMGIVPRPVAGSVGLVGMPNWMWVQQPAANTWGPITKSASAGGYTVTATARVSDVVWDMGDGQAVTCQQGTPYVPVDGKQNSPTCGHTYTRQGTYRVTATSHWVINWAGIGQAGTINMDLTRTATIQIGEAQVLTQ